MQPADELVPHQLARQVNQIWSMDFVGASGANGRRSKLQAVANDFSRKCLEMTVNWGISLRYRTRPLGSVRENGASAGVVNQYQCRIRLGLVRTMVLMLFLLLVPAL